MIRGTGRAVPGPAWPPGDSGGVSAGGGMTVGLNRAAGLQQ